MEGAWPAPQAPPGYDMPVYANLQMQSGVAYHFMQSAPVAAALVEGSIMSGTVKNWDSVAGRGLITSASRCPNRQNNYVLENPILWHFKSPGGEFRNQRVEINR